MDFTVGAILLAALAALHWQAEIALPTEAAWLHPALANRLSSGVEEHSALVSAIGDPGMRSDQLRVALEGWNFCNRAGKGNSGVSPRWADCSDLDCTWSQSEHLCSAIHRVSEFDNNLRAGDAFPGEQFTSYNDPDLYAVEKEKYLGSLCAVDLDLRTWNFWMIMLKNGNYDASSRLCPVSLGSLPLDNNIFLLPNGSVTKLSGAQGGFPCFGPGCMNQPLVYHNLSKPVVVESGGIEGISGLSGGFYGTYDVNSSLTSNETSFFSVNWSKSKSGGSWSFHHVLRSSVKYPWVMLYLRADATSGPSGGYPWETRGMMTTVPQSPHFKVVLTLHVLRGGGPQSQFYLMDIGGCWKNNGDQCDGDIATDVTRYSEMIINPETSAWCNPSALDLCPPIHTCANGTTIHRNDTRRFPYSAYHLYCVPYNALHAEEPFRVCDPYSNPLPQELVQLLPHPEWAVHGYPASKGEGWIGDSRTWELDVGALSSRLYFYQDPSTPAAVRRWPSIDVGAEIYVSGQPETAEWVLSDFNVLVPSWARP